MNDFKPDSSQIAVRSEAIVEVADRGPGVDQDELQKLFEPFFRTRKSAESEGDHGTGLGLAIAERAIRMNGGRIVARNDAGGGLVVRILLPVQPSHAS